MESAFIETLSWSYFERTSMVGQNNRWLPSKIGDNIGMQWKVSLDLRIRLLRVISFITFHLCYFFLLKDGKQFKSISLSYFQTFQKWFGYDFASNGYTGWIIIFRSIFVAFCIGLLLFIGYWIVGLNYAVTLAIVAAVTSVVPYLGPMIAITRLSSSRWLPHHGCCWSSYRLVRGAVLEGTLFPRILWKNNENTPTHDYVHLINSGKIFGVIGVILAIPGYAILKVMVNIIYQKESFVMWDFMETNMNKKKETATLLAVLKFFLSINSQLFWINGDVVCYLKYGMIWMVGMYALPNISFM